MSGGPLGAAATTGWVPTGGTTGQVLQKASGTDYDTGWTSDLAAGTTVGGAVLAERDVSTNTQTDSYVLALADTGLVVELNKATACTLTVPPNSSVTFAVGTVVVVRQYGAGQVTVTAGAGVTIRSRGAALKLAGQYAEASLTQRAADEWVLSGDITT